MCEVDDKTNGDIPIEHRLDWFEKCRRGEFDHVSFKDLEKYLNRGIRRMPWAEMSQADFLKYVVPNQLISDEQLLQASIAIMKAAVENPGGCFDKYSREWEFKSALIEYSYTNLYGDDSFAVSNSKPSL